MRFQRSFWGAEQVQILIGSEVMTQNANISVYGLNVKSYDTIKKKRKNAQNEKKDKKHYIKEVFFTKFK